MSILIQNVTAVLLDESRTVLPNAFVAVEGSQISYVGTKRPAGPFDQVIDGAGKVLMPGFVNAHQADAAMAAFRIHHGPVHPAGRYGQPFRIGVLGPRPRL